MHNLIFLYLVNSKLFIIFAVLRINYLSKLTKPIRSQYILSLTLRFMFSGGRERVHWERMG